MVKRKVWDRLAPVSTLVTTDDITPAAGLQQLKRSTFVLVTFTQVNAVRIDSYSGQKQEIR